MLGLDEVGTFLTDTEMYDLIGQQYGIGAVNNHITGTKQIDFIFGTKGLVNAMTEGGILTFHELIVADHRGMFVDLNWKVLFIGETQEPLDQTKKKVTTSQRMVCKRFWEYVSKQFINKHIIERSEELAEKSKEGYSEDTAYTLEQLDQETSTIMEDAENEIPEFPRFWWSEELHLAFQ
eukprot:14458040-Ditylum_brightwellii.AAC.1